MFHFGLNGTEQEKALEYLKQAESMFKEMDYYLARACVVYSKLDKEEGELSKTKGNLNKAINIMKECGADGWVEKYEKELGALS